MSGIATNGVLLRYNLNGGAYTDGPTASGTSGTFSFTPPSGGGTYCFYTIATDNAGNVEAAPGDASGDGCTVLNTPIADLRVSKTDQPDPVISGQMLNYTVLVTNTGPAAASSLVLTDTLARGVTFVSASAGCAYQVNRHRWGTAASLAVGATHAVTVAVKSTPARPG